MSSIAMSCGIRRRCGLDPALLLLWHRLEATAPIRPLAWEPSYSMGATLKIQKTKKKKKKGYILEPAREKDSSGEIWEGSKHEVSVGLRNVLIPKFCNTLNSTAIRGAHSKLSVLSFTEALWHMHA